MNRLFLFGALGIAACRAPSPVVANSEEDHRFEPAAPEAFAVKPKTLGGLIVVAESTKGAFRVPLGTQSIVQNEMSFFELEGERLVPIPDFLRGAPSFEEFTMSTDMAFEKLPPPTGPAASNVWTGKRDLVAMGGGWPIAWLVTQRGHFDVRLGEVWLHGAKSWTKRAETHRIPLTFAHPAVWRDASLLVLSQSNELKPTFQLVAVSPQGPAPAAPRMRPAPKGCAASVYPEGLIAWPTGDVFMWGSPCRDASGHIAVERWRADAPANAMGTVERLPEGKGEHYFAIVGVQARRPDDVWIAAEDAIHREDAPPPRSYVAHFDGARWAIVPLDPAMKLIHHVTQSADGTISFIDWPNVVWRIGPDSKWTNHALAPELDGEHFAFDGIWGGTSSDLWVAGHSPSTNESWLLHTAP